eukprot:5626665-Pleurochrysis_carterae.AAC.2
METVFSSLPRADFLGCAEAFFCVTRPFLVPCPFSEISFHLHAVSGAPPSPTHPQAHNVDTSSQPKALSARTFCHASALRCA